MRKSTVTAVVFGLVFYMAVQIQNGATGGRSFRAALVVAAVAAFFAWRRLPS